jgi:hypothetical protein
MKTTLNATRKRRSKVGVRALTKRELAKLVTNVRPGYWHCVDKSTGAHNCSHSISEL